MQRIVIDIVNGYFVEADELNFTLKHRGTGTDKDGNAKETERVVGYFSNIQACLEKVVRLIPMAENDGEIMTLKRYAEEAEKSFNKVKEWREKHGTDIKCNRGNGA
ncbi:MAG: hypothetical protein J6J86_04550 [Lachnospiraceae bacterium]|nr:hypothetical protein [Lachnospiraceae bacterium]